MKFIRDFFTRRKVRGKEGSIRRIFFNRATHFTQSTIDVLARMPGAQAAVVELIEERETFKTGGVLEWTEISLVQADSEDALILMVGVVRFPPGAEVELQTGEKVIVTKDTAQYFEPRLVRIGIPLRLAESSKDEVKTYLKQKEAEMEKDTAEFMDNLKEALEGSPPEDDSKETAVSKDDTVTTDADFDLTQLTDEQRKQLQLSQKMGRG